MPVNLIEKNKNQYQKIEYFLSEPGKHFIRFLQPLEEAVAIKFHYIPRFKTSIACLGSECPICENNRQLYAENPGKKWNEIPGLVSTSEKYAINILDRTPVKVCPNTACQSEVKADLTGTFPPSCPKCKTIVTGVDITISDKVKVLTLNRTNAEETGKQELSQLDERGEPKPVTSYDFDVLVVAKGEKREMFPPQANPSRNDPVDVPEELFFDCTQAIVRLTPDEMLEHLKGVSIRDLYAARKAEAIAPKDVTTELTEEQKKQIASEVEDILN